VEEEFLGNFSEIIKRSNKKIEDDFRAGKYGKREELKDTRGYKKDKRKERQENWK